MFRTIFGYFIKSQNHFEETKTATILWQLLCIISYQHQRGIIHSDLKFQNIRFNSSKQQVIKVTDYSISRIFRVEEIMQQTKAKVLLYTPEVLKGGQITSKADIWSLGMIMYTILSGKPQIIGESKQKNKKISRIQTSFQFSKIEVYIKISERTLFKQCSNINQKQDHEQQIVYNMTGFINMTLHLNILHKNLHRCLLECYHFNPSSKLQEATWGFFVNTLITFQEKNTIYEYFQLQIISVQVKLMMKIQKVVFKNFIVRRSLIK